MVHKHDIGLSIVMEVPKKDVFFVENPMKIDDLAVPPF